MALRRAPYVKKVLAPAPIFCGSCYPSLQYAGLHTTGGANADTPRSGVPTRRTRTCRKTSTPKSGFWAELRRTYRGQKSLAWERHARYGGDPRALGGIRRLWEDPQLDHFRRFAAFPVLYRIDRTAQNTCVWFTDLRYVLPYLTPPFRYGLCQDNAAADWNMERLRNQD